MRFWFPGPGDDECRFARALDLGSPEFWAEVGEELMRGFFDRVGISVS